MDLGALFMDAARYTKGTFWGRWKDTLKLLVSFVIFPLFFGYVVQILRGENPAPSVRWSWRMFVDGIKICLIWIFYIVPVLVASVMLITYVLVLYEMEGVGAIEPLLPEIIGGVLGVLVFYILVSLFVNFATIRFARERRFFAAFSFGEIWRCIDRIGFWQYVAAVVLISAFVNAVLALCMLIPVDEVALVLTLLVTIPLGIFQARYYSRIYDLAME
ncbi:DUF4013 domain-containing protein [Methanofollis formosanus]|uniref:DUF4013 domain-containing protein n=1 Tax=Methanofollis formosanus TaxID=299308 RepID=A0A8G1EFG9_9EURY|nr:DUF4013 domain-containing protein [Methanofollis formosanus]QYZ78763.1 DUF4013 domain-containing protein [Methanofollis formosanus]